MANKLIPFRFRGVEYEFNTQLRMVRRVGSANARGYWSQLDMNSKELRNAALNAQKLKECLL